MKSQPPTAQDIIDAYRADAAEREARLRTIVRENAQLNAENARSSKQILFLRECDGVTFAFGLFAGAALFGCAAAVDRNDRDVAVLWGTLAGLFIVGRVIVSRLIWGKRRDQR